MIPRRTLAAALGTGALAAGLPAAAHAAPKSLERAYVKAYETADEQGRPGRNIADDGVVSSSGKPRSARPAELRESLDVLRRMHPAATGGGAAAGGADTASPQLEAIAACESGGDPSAVDASGTYRGKYQFDTGTWASIGGSGDPAAAPEAEQDKRAAMLMAQRGSAPWPVCGG